MVGTRYPAPKTTSNLNKAEYASPQAMPDKRNPNRTRRSKHATRPDHRPALLIPRPPIDELFAPNLTYEALNSQTRESFSGWLVSHFPLTYGSSTARTTINWMDFLRSLQPDAVPPALFWAIRALIVFHMGTLQADENMIYSARHMYGRGIRYLRFLLRSPRALTDEALAAAILLAGYEIVDASDKNAWIQHTRGIRDLMYARGPSSHTSGFGRTLFICFAPFLIAESFILAEPCFLASADWTCVVGNNIYHDQSRRSGGLSLGRAMDTTLNETAKCPGYYAATLYTLAASYNPAILALREVLVHDIAKSRACFLELQAILAEISKDNNTPALDTGSIPPDHARILAQLTCAGVSYTLALLQQLTSLLQSDQYRKLCQPHDMQGPDPWQVYPQQARMESQDNLPLKYCEPKASVQKGRLSGDWLDTFSLTMGIASASGSSPTPVKMHQPHHRASQRT
ncbi:hypothetical protein BJY00DRAFT_302672 [Aspergillus carlsbadensis]|nr:hypothetical protein BJY00DRAFT_302672 [Aspergillus carlsbadensis]